MPDHVLIKKYANRRLYDTEKSSYVTLGQIADMIKSGRQVKVIEAGSEEDVTAFILTQIIVEEARKKNALLPPQLLHLIIQFGENVLSEFFEKYLELTIRNYLTYKASFDEQFRNWLSVGSNLSALAQKNLSPFATFSSFLDLFAVPAGKEDEKKEE